MFESIETAVYRRKSKLLVLLQHSLVTIAKETRPHCKIIYNDDNAKQYLFCSKKYLNFLYLMKYFIENYLRFKTCGMGFCTDQVNF